MINLLPSCLVLLFAIDHRIDLCSEWLLHLCSPLHRIVVQVWRLNWILLSTLILTGELPSLIVHCADLDFTIWLNFGENIYCDLSLEWCKLKLKIPLMLVGQNILVACFLLVFNRTTECIQTEGNRGPSTAVSGVSILRATWWLAPKSWHNVFGIEFARVVKQLWLHDQIVR